MINEVHREYKINVGIKRYFAFGISGGPDKRRNNPKRGHVPKMVFDPGNHSI